MCIRDRLIGNIDEDVFRERVVAEILGDPAHPLAVKLIRLHYESYTVAIKEVDLQTRVDEEDNTIKGIPPAERVVRLREVRERVSPGLEIRGELEPSNWVINALVDQRDKEDIQWIKWETIGTREQERRGEGKTKMDYFEEDEEGLVRKKSKLKPTICSYGTSLSLQELFQRRGVALDVARILGFEEHEKLTKKFMKLLKEDAWDERHAKVSVEQLKAADKRLWAMLSEKVEDGLLGEPGTYLLTNVFQKVLESTPIESILNQRQGGGAV